MRADGKADIFLKSPEAQEIVLRCGNAEQKIILSPRSSVRLMVER